MFHFNLPLLNRPILWYGFFFALGFFLAYLVLLSLIKRLPELSKSAKMIAEKMTFYTILGAVIGARLGDLLFYQSFSDIVHDPLIIIKVWEGGLASHGGAAGILLALYILSLKLRKEFPKLTFLALLDLAVIPTGLAAAFIRLGNFFNQEILGKATQIPWAVVFGHPADGSYPTPRHPVQLYEAFFYLITFTTLYLLWNSGKIRSKGKASGLFLILIFTFRFFVEFLKEEQSVHVSLLNMGQWLSLPFIGLGFFLFFRKTVRK